MKLTDLLTEAHDVAKTAEAVQGSDYDLAPGMEGAVTVNTDLGMLTITWSVPAPLMPDGAECVEIKRTPDRVDVERLKKPDPAPAPKDEPVAG